MFLGGLANVLIVGFAAHVIMIIRHIIYKRGAFYGIDHAVMEEKSFYMLYCIVYRICWYEPDGANPAALYCRAWRRQSSPVLYSLPQVLPVSASVIFFGW